MLEPEAGDRDGRLKSALKTAGRRFLQGGGIVGAVAGAVEGAVDPATNEREAQQRQRAQDRALAGELLGSEKEHAALELAQQKPGLERDKVQNKRRYDDWRMKSSDRKQDTAENYVRWRMADGDARARSREGRDELMREWRLHIQPEQFDRALSQRGEQFDRLFEQRDDHLTRRLSQQQRQFDQTFGLNVDNYLERVRHNLTGEAKDRFDIATRDRIPRLKAIHTDIERWQRRKADGSTRAGEADDYILELQQEANGLASQIEAVREAVLSGSSTPLLPAPNNATPVRPNARRGTAAVRTPAAGGAYSGQRIPRANLKAAAERLGVGSESEAERIIKREGGTVY